MTQPKSKNPGEELSRDSIQSNDSDLPTGKFIVFILSMIVFFFIAIAAIISYLPAWGVDDNTPPSPESFLDEKQLQLLTQTNLPNFHKVEPYLYRGAAPTPEGIQILKTMGIKTIIDLRVTPALISAEKKEAEKAGIKYINIPTHTGFLHSAEQQRFMDIVSKAANDSSQGPVFIHCSYGAERTGMMVAQWRMLHDHWTYQQAFDEMTRYGFLTHLIDEL